LFIISFGRQYVVEVEAKKFFSGRFANIVRRGKKK
jgi:hypothetical protein